MRETVFLPPLVIPMAVAPIEMDGRVEEAAWAEAPLLPSVMHLPEFGAEPTERTEFRLVHDGKFLYFSCKAFDSDPTGIRAPSLLRDERRFLNDSCSLYLDTANELGLAVGIGVLDESRFNGKVHFHLFDIEHIFMADRSYTLFTISVTLLTHLH